MLTKIQKQITKNARALRKLERREDHGIDLQSPIVPAPIAEISGQKIKDAIEKLIVKARAGRKLTAIEHYALVHYGKANPLGSETYIQTARDMYRSAEIEIDDEPVVSEGDDGAFVSAWVWVPKPGEVDCACNGRGWLHMRESHEGRPGIERCDTCEVFETEEEAAEAHAKQCICGMDVAPCLTNEDAEDRC